MQKFYDMKVTLGVMCWGGGLNNWKNGMPNYKQIYLPAVSLPTTVA